MSPWPSLVRPKLITLDDVLNFIETKKRFTPSAGGLHHFGFHVPASEWRKVLARLRRAGVPVDPQ